MASAQSSDAKLWTGFVGKIELAEPLNLNLEHQERLSSDKGIEKNLTEGKLSLRVHDYVRLAGAYRVIATEADSFWHRYSADAIAGYEIGALELSYRLRYQTTVRPTENRSLVRNKFGVEYDMGKTSPWAAFELHYSTDKSEFREARFALGVERKLSKKIKIGAFYMFQNEFNKRIEERNHVLGVEMTYVFRRIKKKSKPLPLEAASLAAR